jgi:aspartate 1-decarboxylase
MPIAKQVAIANKRNPARLDVSVITGQKKARNSGLFS